MILYCLNQDPTLVYDCPIEDEVSMEHPADLASLCAAHYFYHHGGWDRTWPMMITLLDPHTHQVTQSFSVSIVMTPSFVPSPQARVASSSDGVPHV